MKRLLLLTTLIAALVLAACSPAGQPPATSQPTDEPTEISATPVLTASNTVTPVAEPSPTLPAGAVIVLSQSGGLAGVMNTWMIYADGQVVYNDSQQLTVEPAVVEEALRLLDEANFFTLNMTKPSDVCCDFFTFTLTAQAEDGRMNSITISEGDAQMTDSLRQAIQHILDAVGSTAGGAATE